MLLTWSKIMAAEMNKQLLMLGAELLTLCEIGGLTI